jgi:hypothetical protein
MEISRFPCKRLRRMPGSTTTRGRHAFCGTENVSTPNLSYAAQYLAYALPYERFTSPLAGGPCITRGQCGSLLLHCDGFPPSTFCRSPGAPVHHIITRHCVTRAVCRLASEIEHIRSSHMRILWRKLMKCDSVP